MSGRAGGHSQTIRPDLILSHIEAGRRSVEKLGSKGNLMAGTLSWVLTLADDAERLLAALVALEARLADSHASEDDAMRERDNAET